MAKFNKHSPNTQIKKPNVLIIMTDQHRADLMSCAGAELVATPNIDRIALRGARFNNAYCPYPVCVASRMSLLTGLYAHNTGAIDNTDQLDWRYRTMANHFVDNGYLTALIGKMHFLDAHNHGFEYYMSINDWLMYLGPKVRHYANEVANHQMEPAFFETVFDTGTGLPDVEDLWDGPSPWVGNVERWSGQAITSSLEPQDHLDMFIARESTKFLKRYKDQSFFLVTSFMKPHSPFYPPKKWAQMYPPDKMELKPVGDLTQYPPHIQDLSQFYQRNDPERLRAARAGYMGNLAFVDECIGYVCKALEQEGLLDNTIVIYTSDHGEMDGDHGIYQKFCLFEPAVRVPLIVSYPERIPQNKVANALTEYIGIYPTLVELTGIEQPENTTLLDIPGAPDKMDAVSFADVLLNPDLNGPPAVFCEYALKDKICQYMIRTKHYKYIFNHGSMNELYDLEADPGEFVNHVDEPGLRKIQNQLQDQLFAWYNPEKNSYHPA